MKLTATEAFQLSIVFRDAAIAAGDRKIKEWETLSAKQRKDLDDAEWSLLNGASDMVTLAIGLSLDDSVLPLGKLTGVVKSAKTALKQLEDIRKAIKVATALVGLAAAVITRDFGAVAKNAQAVADAADIKLNLPDLPL